MRKVRSGCGPSILQGLAWDRIPGFFCSTTNNNTVAGVTRATVLNCSEPDHRAERSVHSPSTKVDAQAVAGPTRI
ncbi:MAG: hypothetical protein ACRDHN_16320, partial [Thermomicrobiales bacterium]